MPIPTEPVGSLPRPATLQAALADYDAGRISREQLTIEQDAACLDSIRRMEATGAPIVSDGEQRASSFATYPITDTLGGTGLADNLAADGQYFAIFTDGHHRQLPRLTGGPFRYKTFAASYRRESDEDGYETAQAGGDRAVDAGPAVSARRRGAGLSARAVPRRSVSTSARRTSGCASRPGRRGSRSTSPRAGSRVATTRAIPGPGAACSASSSSSTIACIDRFSAEERKNIGIHTCPGGDCDSTHSADVDYAELLPSMFKMNAGYFLMQLASEPDKERVYRLVGEHSREDAGGVAQVCFIGVINPQNPRVETAEEVCSDLLLAAKYIPKERLGSTDDCGFSPFSIDTKPKHGSPDLARDIAFQKITARVEGTKLAAAKLGL